MAPTTIPTISPERFADRLADLFPRGWASDDAKQTGNVYALLLSLGQQLTFLQGELQYALNAQRLGTETFPELDFASIDFLADGLPRPAGMSDALFAQAIIAQLFRPAATREALQNALTALTGFVPRMLEPWSVVDTGAWTNFSYWNVDTVANPARWGNGGLRYQGFIETAPPSIPAIGPNNPILTWGTAYWDVPGYFFGIIPPVQEDAVDDLINTLRAYGTIVWLKLVASGSLPSATSPTAVNNLTAVSAGANSVLISWTAPTTGTPPYTFIVLYRQSGTVTFSNGPSVSVSSATVPNLVPGTSYDFEVIARNIAGSALSGVVTAFTTLFPPSPAQSLSATLVQATAVTLAWLPPATGTPPFTYSVNYRVTGTTTWQNLIVGRGALTVTVINLIPNTAYDFEVLTTNI